MPEELPPKRPARIHRSRFRPGSPRLKKILAPVDFSKNSDRGAHFAVSLASQFGASVSLIHVVEPPSPFSGMESVVLARDNAEMVRNARAHLSVLAKRESVAGIKISHSVRQGKPFHEIAAEANERDSDLVVVATHGYTGVERVLMGSTAERIVRHAPCSVLTVPAPANSKKQISPPSLRFGKIVVPIDFSDISSKAMPWAKSLAIRDSAELILVHVVEKYPIDFLLGKDIASNSIVPLKKRAKAALERVAKTLSQPLTGSVTVSVREGKPYVEVCHLAKILGADLIVQTTHGYTGIQHAWLGSTAERIVRHAPCPVLTVRSHHPKGG